MTEITKREAILDLLKDAGVKQADATKCADWLLSLSPAQWRVLKSLRDSKAEHVEVIDFNGVRSYHA